MILNPINSTKRLQSNTVIDDGKDRNGEPDLNYLGTSY